MSADRDQTDQALRACSSDEALLNLYLENHYNKRKREVHVIISNARDLKSVEVFVREEVAQNKGHPENSFVKAQMLALRDALKESGCSPRALTKSLPEGFRSLSQASLVAEIESRLDEMHELLGEYNSVRDNVQIAVEQHAFGFLSGLIEEQLDSGESHLSEDQKRIRAIAIQQGLVAGARAQANPSEDSHLPSNWEPKNNLPKGWQSQDQEFLIETSRRQLEAMEIRLKAKVKLRLIDFSEEWLKVRSPRFPDAQLRLPLESIAPKEQAMYVKALQEYGVENALIARGSDGITYFQMPLADQSKLEAIKKDMIEAGTQAYNGFFNTAKPTGLAASTNLHETQKQQLQDLLPEEHEEFLLRKGNDLVESLTTLGAPAFLKQEDNQVSVQIGGDLLRSGSVFEDFQRLLRLFIDQPTFQNLRPLALAPERPSSTVSLLRPAEPNGPR
jgi:hypothetical protein